MMTERSPFTVRCSKVGTTQRKRFSKLLEEPEIGRIYDGVVKRIVDFGAFIEFLPGKEALCHISKMSTERVEDIHDVLHLNQSVSVKIIEIDKMGRVNLCIAEDAIIEKLRARKADRFSMIGVIGAADTIKVEGDHEIETVVEIVEIEMTDALNPLEGGKRCH